MKLSFACLLALLAFINLYAAMVIPNEGPEAIAAVVGLSSTENPQTTINHHPNFPFNTTDLELGPPFVVLSSVSSSNTDGEKKASPPSNHFSSQLPAKREEKVPKKKQVKPPPCPYPETRVCITQKEVDQGWHDRAGCYNRNLFLLGFGPDTAINPSNVHDKRWFGYSTSYNVNRKIKPYCPAPRSEYRNCATQKEVDQGWHDTAGCHRVPFLRFLGLNTDQCWVAGARCIKKNCKY